MILVKVFWAMSKWANSQLLFERSEWMSKWALSEFSALNFLQVGVRPTGPGAGHWGCWGSHPCPCPGGQDLCGGGLLDQWLHSTGACLLYILYIHYFHNLCYCSLISNVNVLYVNFFFICEKYKIKLISVPSKASTGKYTVDWSLRIYNWC